MIPYLATQGVRRICFAAALTLLGLLTGCDRYLISVCNFSDEWPGCREEVVDASVVDLHPVSSSPIGPLRKFEWRAKIGDRLLNQFVGIDKRQYAIFLVAGSPVYFGAVKFRFDLPANMNQLESVECMGCPKLVDINFDSDSIFLTGEAERQFWLLRYGITRKSYRLNADGSLVLMDADMDPTWWNKPFFHPVLNASSIQVKPPTSSGSSLIARLQSSGSTIKYGIERPTKISAQAIGDLDSIDLGKRTRYYKYCQ